MDNKITTLRKLEIDQLHSAVWNTHAKENPKQEPMKGLIESVRANGVIQRILVRVDHNGGYEIVDGHRRVAAARAAGLFELDCEVADLTDAEAQVITATANLQRTDNDPLLEAELIQRLREADMTYAQIAASIGKPEGYVARRARLCSLADCWRKHAKAHPYTVDALERIAAHEEDLQKEMFKAMDMAHTDEPGYRYGREESSVFSWADFKDHFARALREVKKAPFNSKKLCANCEYNTATHALLFPELAEEGEAHCQNATCWIRHANEAFDAKVTKLRAKGIEPVKVKDEWSMPDHWSTTDKPTELNTVPYWWEGTDGLKQMKWGHPRVKTVAEAKTPEQKKKEREEKKAERIRAKHVRDVRDRIRRVIEDDRITEGMVEEIVNSERGRGWLRSYITGMAARGWISDDVVDSLWRLAGPELLNDLVGFEDEDEAKDWTDEISREVEG